MDHRLGTAALAAIALIALISPALAADIPIPDTVPRLGGDDVLVAHALSMSDLDAIDLAVAPNGDYYAVTTVATNGSGANVLVYRSTDAGDSWALWGSKGLSMTQSFLHPEIEITQGPSQRLVLVYE